MRSVQQWGESVWTTLETACHRDLGRRPLVQHRRQIRKSRRVVERVMSNGSAGQSHAAEVRHCSEDRQHGSADHARYDDDTRAGLRRATWPAL